MEIIKSDWSWNGTLAKRSSTKYIALHHAEAVSCTARQVDEWHKSNGWAGIGYHFFVRKDGSIYEGRPLWALGAHVQGKNNVSVGICAEGDYHNHDKIMPQAQKSAIKQLIAYLKGLYPNAEIVGHGEIGESNCPGRYYPLAEMKNYEQEDEPMTPTDREKFNGLVNAVSDLAAKIDKMTNPMIYNYVDDNMPQWAREGAQWCIDHGIITGTGEGLGLDDRDLKCCTMIMRLMKNR